VGTVKTLSGDQGGQWGHEARNDTFSEAIVEGAAPGRLNGPRSGATDVEKVIKDASPLGNHHVQRQPVGKIASPG
jgi:hypothetical protein